MNQLFSRLVPAVLVVLAAVQSAHASIIINAVESNGNVVFSGGGTLDLTGLDIIFFGASNNGFLAPDLAWFGNGNGITNVFSYTVTGPTSFGPGIGGFAFASFISGNIFELNGSDNIVSVQSDYVSGDQLSFSATFNNQTFASLGLKTGKYVWTFVGGDEVQTVTLNIVPEPGTLASFAAVGLLGLLPLRRRRNQQLHNA